MGGFCTHYLEGSRRFHACDDSPFSLLDERLQVRYKESAAEHPWVTCRPVGYSGSNIDALFLWHHPKELLLLCMR